MTLFENRQTWFTSKSDKIALDLPHLHPIPKSGSVSRRNGRKTKQLSVMVDMLMDFRFEIR